MRPAGHRAALVLALTLAGLSRPAPARADLSDGELVAAGLAMAPPTYVLGVTVHEGSHALIARLLGARVVDFTILPGRDPISGAFHFGRTRVRGLAGSDELGAFFLAPKVTDLAMLGGFAALLYAGGGADDGAAWPSSRVGALALTVLATGFWVDFAKDVLAFSRHNDVNKAMSLAGLTTEWRRLPVRLAYLAADVALGVLVWQGYRRVFWPSSEAAARAIRPGTTTIPLLTASF